MPRASLFLLKKHPVRPDYLSNALDAVLYLLYNKINYNYLTLGGYL